jgi:hypothetical protein
MKPPFNEALLPARFASKACNASPENEEILPFQKYQANSNVFSVVLEAPLV